MMNGGFDWNGNGRSDAFDHYMNMKASSKSGTVATSESNPSNSASVGVGITKIAIVLFFLLFIVAPLYAGLEVFGAAMFLIGVAALAAYVFG